MFLQNLNFEQQRVFLKLANEIIRADGVLSPMEDNLLAELKLQLHANIVPATEIGKLEKIFDTKKSKISVLTEIIGIGFIDNKFDLKEKKYVQKIGKELNLSQDEIKFCINWVDKQFDLMKEIKKRMEN
ncbi:MAG: hypothetical protein WC212_00420 [Candidatus Delongbacteria bacterium]